MAGMKLCFRHARSVSSSVHKGRVESGCGTVGAKLALGMFNVHITERKKGALAFC